MNKKYFPPEILTLYVERDIITYSETEEWEGPIIKSGLDEDEE